MMDSRSQVHHAGRPPGQLQRGPCIGSFGKRVARGALFQSKAKAWQVKKAAMGCTRCLENPNRAAQTSSTSLLLRRKGTVRQKQAKRKGAKQVSLSSKRLSTKLSHSRTGCLHLKELKPLRYTCTSETLRTSEGAAPSLSDRHPCVHFRANLLCDCGHASKTCQ